MLTKGLLRRIRVQKKKIMMILVVGVTLYFLFQSNLISQLSKLNSKLAKNEFQNKNLNNIDKYLKHNRNKYYYFANKIKKEHVYKKSDINFICKSSGKVISEDRVNDDYCDCIEDGSDEYLTNACDNGIFKCKNFKTKFPSQISSTWVNDGVCDCCDGSDEYLGVSFDSHLSLESQEAIEKYISPCPDIC